MSDEKSLLVAGAIEKLADDIDDLRDKVINNPQVRDLISEIGKLANAVEGFRQDFATYAKYNDERVKGLERAAKVANSGAIR